MCPSHLDGETAWAPKRSGRYYPYWLVQFSRSAEAQRRRTFTVRSLKTEQRRGRDTRSRPVSPVDIGIAP